MAAPAKQPKHVLEFGRRVREMRCDYGWSQMDLADRAEMYFTYISRIERGEQAPTLTTIVRLAEALEIDPAELVAGLDPS